MTYDRSRLTKLGREHRRLKAALERVRADLADEIPKANAGDVPQNEIAALADYTRESVRQLCLTPEQREAEKEKRRRRLSGTPSDQ